MKKVLIISLALFGVVFLAGCGRKQTDKTQPTILTPVAQQPTQTTDNSQLINNQSSESSSSPVQTGNSIYQNKNYGFELKYLKSFKYREFDEENEVLKRTTHNIVIGANVTPESNYSDIRIVVFKLEASDGSLVEHIMPASRQQHIVGGIKGYVYGSGDASLTYVVVRNSYQYEIEFGSEISKNTVDQVISSFKFTK